MQSEINKITRGSIIWWTFIRVILVVLIMWLVESKIEYSQWWSITVGAIFVVGIYPAHLQYQKFNQLSEKIVDDILCTSCRYFDPDQLLCKKLDTHVTQTYIPCYGEGWEPLTYEDKRFGEV